MFVAVFASIGWCAVVLIAMPSWDPFGIQNARMEALGSLAAVWLTSCAIALVGMPLAFYAFFGLSAGTSRVAIWSFMPVAALLPFSTVEPQGVLTWWLCAALQLAGVWLIVFLTRRAYGRVEGAEGKRGNGQ